MDYKFKIGDEVKYIGSSYSFLTGWKGTIIKITAGELGVEFKGLFNKTQNGHSLGDYETLDGWWVYRERVKLYKKTTDPRFTLIGEEVRI